MKLKYISFGICIIIILLCWYFIIQRENHDLDKEIEQDINSLEALPLSYSLEDAIQDGYYYEKRPVNKTPDSIIKFLSYVDDNTKATFRTVSDKNNTLSLTNVTYVNGKYTVINYYINSKTNERNYSKSRYSYLIVLTNQKNSTYAYYLTNNKKLYESIKVNPLKKYDMEKQNAFYLFSRGFATKK